MKNLKQIREAHKERNIPDDRFFDEQRTQIWSTALDLHDANPNGFSPKTSRTTPIAAALVFALATAGVLLHSSKQEPCKTFACLWEATESIEIDESELELWLSDDALYWELYEAL